MKIREVSSVPPKVETPFVVGGVYESSIGERYILGSYGNGTYAWIGLSRGSINCKETKESIQSFWLAPPNAMRYIPDAELVVPAPTKN
jgi:hypothetical protein